MILIDYEMWYYEYSERIRKAYPSSMLSVSSPMSPIRGTSIPRAEKSTSLSRCVYVSNSAQKKHAAMLTYKDFLENLVYHFLRQLWLVLGVKLMEINSNLFSRLWKKHWSIVIRIAKIRDILFPRWFSLVDSCRSVLWSRLATARTYWNTKRVRQRWKPVKSGLKPVSRAVMSAATLLQRRPDKGQFSISTLCDRTFQETLQSNEGRHVAHSKVRIEC